jgi:hypothetical protein
VLAHIAERHPWAVGLFGFHSITSSARIDAGKHRIRGWKAGFKLDAQRLGSFQVDDQVETCGSFDWQVREARALENFVLALGGSGPCWKAIDGMLDRLTIVLPSR